MNQKIKNNGAGVPQNRKSIRFRLSRPNNCFEIQCARRFQIKKNVKKRYAVFISIETLLSELHVFELPFFGRQCIAYAIKRYFLSVNLLKLYIYLTLFVQFG